MYPSNALNIRKFIPIIGLFFALAWTSPAFTSPDKRADAEALTHSLVGLNTAYQKAGPNAKSQALQKLVDATIERQALLAELIKTDPGAVLRVAMPERVRKNMPAEVQSFLELRLELEGELEVVYEDYEDGSHHLRHALQANGKRIALQFKSPPSGLLSGTPAQVSGVLLGDAMAVESGREDVLTLALGGGENGGTNGGTPAPLPNTFGEQRVAVILVNFPTHPSEPWTKAEAYDIVFNEVDAFFQENSQGQTWFSGEVYGWFTLDLDPSSCPATDISIKARQAAGASGADLSGVDRFIYAFPDIGCPWSGMGDVGGAPSNSWIDGYLSNAGTVSHELGHNFGLYHSHLSYCYGDPQLSDSCANWEYGDLIDRMGYSTAGHFTAFQKERLGWLNYGESAAIVSADSSGSYMLEAYASASKGVKAVRILRDIDPVSGQPRSYYLENRQAVGFDEHLATWQHGPAILNGLVFHVGTWGDADSSYLLHMTPESSDLGDLALAQGASYTDPVAGVTVTVDSVDSGEAILTVDYGPQSCAHADPTMTITPSQGGWVVPGTPVTYTATILNNDSAACGGASFALTASVPTGWSVGISTSQITLAPGESSSTSLTVSSSVTAADGTYDIGIAATHEANPIYSDSATATYTVMAEAGSANEAPVAVDDNVTLTQVASVVIDVLANDWDPDGDTVQLTAASQGSKGTVVINSDGTLSYTPGRRFRNKDSFSYDISDGTETATAAVSISLQESSKGGGGKGKPKG